MSGKGSGRRPRQVSKAEADANWDRIFNKETRDARQPKEGTMRGEPRALRETSPEGGDTTSTDTSNGVAPDVRNSSTNSDKE